MTSSNTLFGQDSFGFPRWRMKRGLLSYECFFCLLLCSTSSHLQMLISTLQRPIERTLVRPGPWKSTLTPNAFVFRDPTPAANFQKRAMTSGLRMGQDRAMTLLYRVDMNPRAALHGPMPMAPELPSSNFPGSLGPSLTKSVRSVLSWILGHCHL